ncbi:MAG: lytic murein transglycosylase [Alphaproteobacteria bacterium]|nr:lytic murein transglycosylase [Alphaproteobacteria bacterium]
MSRHLLIKLVMLAVIFTGSTPSIAAESAKTEDYTPTESFSDWLEQFKIDARTAGITPTTIETALGSIEPIPRVIELDRKQPEFSLTFREYLNNVGSDDRIARGKRKLAEHRKLLNRVSAKYGVPPQVIVALWAVETDFGRLTGGFEVIPALATLAHDGRRSNFFRQELINALTIIDQGHISAANMIGSWAGAMGQCQFMPSSFLNAAVDDNHDGRKDIWKTQSDVFASAANLMRRNGWVKGRIWGRPVLLPDAFDMTLVGHETSKTLAEWQTIGVRRSGGRDLPRVDITGSIIMPAGADGPAFLVYENFRAILKWNRSDFFALTVGYLSDRISGKKTVMFLK